MLRRAPRKEPIVMPRKRKSAVVFEKVGGPYPAPRPMRGNINLPTANMGTGCNNCGCYFGQGGNSGYDDMGLDDYNALHYYGLDGLDNIDF